MSGRLFWRSFSGAALLATFLSSCGRLWPTEADRTVDDTLLAGMRLEIVNWPDTLPVGARADAEVELVLANGRPYPADYVDWVVDSVRIVGLSPTDRKEVKRVLAFSQGTTRVNLTAWVYKPHGDKEWYRTDCWMWVVVR
jgi:hypothetical protein